ncbi:MAG: hypothetical protein H7228_04315 [Polaromonas sp.]|nr:hypothetical protein [Polaromonas sp.]
MTHQLGNISVAVLLLSAAGVALAAQPADPAAAARAKGNANSGIVSKAVGPGTLTGLSAGASEVDAGKPLAFSFTGSGHCKLTLAGGDGSTTEFEGDLPFVGNYTFGTGSMLSSDVFKNYNTTAIPQGPCSAGSKLKPVAVKVNNPMPQGVAPAGNPNTVSSSQSGKVLSPGKPGNGPVLPGVLTGITLSGKTVAGAPTLLTVAGTGNCKYHVSYVNLDAQGNTIVKQYPMVPKASNLQSPFPMTFQMIAATPAGIYKWTATAAEGCSGDVNTTFAAQ